jgi:hypothetical protein
VSNPRILTVPANFKTLNLTLTNAWQIKIPFCKCIRHFLSYANFYYSLSPAMCLSYFTHNSISLHALVTYHPPCYHTDLCITTRCYSPPSYAKITYISELILIFLIRVILSNVYSKHEVKICINLKLSFYFSHENYKRKEIKEEEKTEENCAPIIEIIQFMQLRRI